jgi:hypothetical protein
VAVVLMVMLVVAAGAVDLHKVGLLFLVLALLVQVVLVVVVPILAQQEVLQLLEH